MKWTRNVFCLLNLIVITVQIIRDWHFVVILYRNLVYPVTWLQKLTKLFIKLTVAVNNGFKWERSDGENLCPIRSVIAKSIWCGRHLIFATQLALSWSELYCTQVANNICIPKLYVRLDLFWCHVKGLSSLTSSMSFCRLHGTAVLKNN